MVQPYFTALLAEERICDLRAFAPHAAPGIRLRTWRRVRSAFAAGVGGIDAWFRRGQLGPVPDPRCAPC